MPDRLFARLPIERILLFATLALGALHAWFGRYSMNPDGISYLDVGDSFFRRDWANAVNAYWSPLYPWTLGVVLGLAKPSPKWEFPLVHLVNFGVFAVTLFAFRFLLHALLAFGKERDSAASPDDGHPLPEWALVLLAYSIFWWTASQVEAVYGVSPDLAVMACVCMAAGMLLRLRQGYKFSKFAWFGLILAVGYWTKAILLPIGFVTLGAAYLWKRSDPGWGRRIAVAGLVSLCACAPLIALLSHQKGRFTFGDSGRLNYAWFVSRGTFTRNWQGGVPGSGTPVHPTRQLLRRPALFEFDGPVVGTYPPWTDPSYWNEGLQWHFHSKLQMEELAVTIPSEIRLLFSDRPELVAGIIALALISGQLVWAGLRELWPFLAMSLAVMGIYLPVHEENRFLGGSVLVLFLVLLAAARFRPEVQKTVACVAVAVFLVMALGTADYTVRVAMNHMAIPGTGPDSAWQDVVAAEQLRRMGAQPGDKVAVIADGTGAYWARLAKLRIVAKIMDANHGSKDFWDAPEPVLALQVIRQLNLDKRPEFGGHSDPAQPNLVADPLQADSSHISALLGSFRGNLHVALVPNTRIINIQYNSTDPQLAASAVNTLAATYVEQNFKTKFESTRQASDWLSKQLVDLQMKVETSQEKLVRYQKEHEILGTDEKQNIITEKLGELNKEMTGAESDRMQKEAVYRQTQSNDPVEVSAAIVSDTAGRANDLSSALLDKLREQQVSLRIQVAELSTQFGPSYPKIAQINNQLKEIDRQLQSETTKAVDHLKGQYLAALQRENMLRGSFEKQKQEANKLNESAIEYSILKRDLDSNRTLYEGLLEKLKEAGVTAGLRSNNFRIINAARVPTSPSQPNIPRNLTFALLLGVISGVSVAFLLESMDNTVRTPEQAQALSCLPSLGMIPLGSKSASYGVTGKRLALTASPELVETVTQVRPQSQMAESYRALRTSLLLSNLGAPPKVIMVTSARPQEGKTTTSINIAIVLAQKGVRVLLIDADLRRPSIHKTLGMGPRSGLSNVLTGSATLQQTVATSPILPNLFIMPAGTPPPNPAELLASSNMRDLLEELREQFDHVVIDTPPTLSVTDAVVLSPRADATILVIRSGQTTKQALRRARDILTQVNAHIAGVLLNAVDLTSPDYYYYYEYQGKYGSYYREDAPDAGDEAEPKAV